MSAGSAIRKRSRSASEPSEDSSFAERPGRYPKRTRWDAEPEDVSDFEAGVTRRLTDSEYIIHTEERQVKTEAKPTDSQISAQTPKTPTTPPLTQPKTGTGGTGPTLRTTSYPSVRLLSVHEAQIVFDDRNRLQRPLVNSPQLLDKSYLISEPHSPHLSLALPKGHFYALINGVLQRIQLTGGEGMLFTLGESMGFGAGAEAGTESKTLDMVVGQEYNLQQVEVSSTEAPPAVGNEPRLQIIRPSLKLMGEPAVIQESDGQTLLSAFKKKSALIQSSSESGSKSPTASDATSQLTQSNSDMELVPTTAGTSRQTSPDKKSGSVRLSPTGGKVFNKQSLVSKEKSPTMKSQKGPRPQSSTITTKSRSKQTPSIGGPEEMRNKGLDRLLPASSRSQSQSLLLQFQEKSALLKSSTLLSLPDDHSATHPRQIPHQSGKQRTQRKRIQTSQNVSPMQPAQSSPSLDKIRSSPPLSPVPQDLEALTKSPKLANFANQLSSLAAALYKAIEVLPPLALEDLEAVLENDWLVEDMEKMVVGVISYANGRGKEGEIPWRGRNRSNKL